MLGVHERMKSPRKKKNESKKKLKIYICIRGIFALYPRSSPHLKSLEMILVCTLTPYLHFFYFFFLLFYFTTNLVSSVGGGCIRRNLASHDKCFFAFLTTLSVLVLSLALKVIYNSFFFSFSLILVWRLF